MWYKFWTQLGDAGMRSEPEVRYEWYDEAPSEASLEDQDKETADDLAMRMGCRAWAGHEGPFDAVPPEVAQVMLMEAEEACGKPERYLAILKWRLGVGEAMKQAPPSVFDEIKAEQDRQQIEFGGPTVDDQRPLGDWKLILDVQMGKLAGTLMGGRQSPRRRLIQVAAVCVSIIESMDRRRARE